MKKNTAQHVIFYLILIFLSLIAFIPEAKASFSEAQALIAPQIETPSAWVIIKILLLLTFFIHIVLVNVLLGSVSLALVCAWKKGSESFKASKHLQSDISFTPSVLALAVNFGVAPFLFAQVAYGSFLYPSIVLMALWWLAIPLVVIFAYYGLYIAKSDKFSSSNFSLHKRLILTLSAILLFFVAFLLTNNSSLALRPDLWLRWFAKPGGILLNLGDSTFIPRYLHIITASIAVGGLVLAIRAKRRLVNNEDKVNNQASIECGLNWFFWASILQALSGLWFLFALPSYLRNLFFGQSIIATSAILLLILALFLALRAARSGRVYQSTGYALGCIFIMVCIRDFVRDAMLSIFSSHEGISVVEKAKFSLEQLWINFGAVPYKITRQPMEIAHPILEGQAVAFLIFMVFLAIGLIAIFWMAKVSLKAFHPKTTESFISGSLKQAGDK